MLCCPWMGSTTLALLGHEEEAKGGGLVPGTPGEGAPCAEGRTEPGTELPVGSPRGRGRPGQEGELIQCLGWKHRPSR